MPRDLTPGQHLAAAAPRLHLALLVECEFDAEPLRLWSGIGPLQWGNRQFTGAGTLMNVTEVEEASEVRAGVTTLGLSGIPAEVIDAALNVDWQGKPARVWLALLTDSGQLLDEPLQLLSGRMDTLNWSEGETASVALSVENRLVDLQRPRIRRYTDADQQSEYPGDLAFQYVASLIERDIRWGS